MFFGAASLTSVSVLNHIITFLIRRYPPLVTGGSEKVRSLKTSD